MRSKLRHRWSSPAVLTGSKNPVCAGDATKPDAVFVKNCALIPKRRHSVPLCNRSPNIADSSNRRGKAAAGLPRTRCLDGDENGDPKRRKKEEKFASSAAAGSLMSYLGKDYSALKGREKRAGGERKAKPHIRIQAAYQVKEQKLQKRKQISIVKFLGSLQSKNDVKPSGVLHSTSSSQLGSSSDAEPLGQDGSLSVCQGITSCGGETPTYSGGGLSVSVPDDSCKLPGKADKFPAFMSPPVLQELSELFLVEAEKDQQQVFTPFISEEFGDESYRFRCSSPGLYQCEVTGLEFQMEGEGEVLYRSVLWDRNMRLLSQHHQKPAGPLFDIECQQKSVFQLRLPHCEILSTGGARRLSVAHVTDEGIEFLRPHKITETHVIINITGFSAFGIVQEEDSPPAPVQALVLLFYKPPDEDRPARSSLSVLLVPRNIVIRDVQRTRYKLNGLEKYIDVPSHCKLKPKQLYMLSTCPVDSQVKVQPTEAEFDEKIHSSYFPSFQVIFRTSIDDINLSLTEKSSSDCVWEREVSLSPSTAPALNRSSSQKLLDVFCPFIDRISNPVLHSLLDKLFEGKIITDSEREAAEETTGRREKARHVLNTVRKKGEAASSEMIEFLCEVDPFFSESLGLK